jgi:oxygen-independent coproporphyrinogen-3 oxidase
VNPEHLYIHVPFCVRRCGYCDFAVTATRTAPVDAWLDAVGAELLMRTRRYDGPLPLRTIYVGGGTPSLLGTGAMARLGDLLRRFATWDADVEWTAEANPESFTPELAADWRRAGINRVSLGAQTFDPAALRWMGRMHGPDGPARALAAARDAGLDNVSIDLIFALPGRLSRDWAADLERVIELAPEHVSLYGLTAEAGTPLGRSVREGRESMADEDSYANEYLLACDRLGAAGFGHYEVSSFARPGRHSRHNQAYWKHRPYLGLGPGAHSYEPPARTWNVRDWAEYRLRLAQDATPEDGREVLAADDVALERVWLGLRTAEGLALDELAPEQLERVDEWRAAGWAHTDGSAVRLTRHGWLLLDRLAVELASVHS